MTPRVGFLNYPNQVTGLKVLLGRRLPLRASVQRRYVLFDPTGPDHISVRLSTGVTFTMVKESSWALKRSNCTDQRLRVLKNAN